MMLSFARFTFAGASIIAHENLKLAEFCAPLKQSDRAHKSSLPSELEKNVALRK